MKFIQRLLRGRTASLIIDKIDRLISEGKKIREVNSEYYVFLMIGEISITKNTLITLYYGYVKDMYLNNRQSKIVYNYLCDIIEYDKYDKQALNYLKS